ncbi:4-hydroxy-tetrahydrodipicolinate reductase, partial [Candidatus Saccharibacteria bacterium]|nr:4-hydroxy-tetrahydrodipicolinate reductase [Candidatus Saccharibacteria bacterium]NIV04593.1 4-hydroxy-tetrahydrodipicolinate reductase [Calditrichia bacterium]NIV73207.1 4-hydroxy-tetrahydrodipicolinate reductase [Calditrichia bacterium]NIW80930.1 4-hydroxy-tetrahydrodipicolinate reductase [Calditrichia bacterium]
MIRVVINGILGRMGQEISNAILRDQDVILIGGVDTLETFYADEVVVSTDPNEVLGDTDTVIDFSSPEGTVNIAKSCLERKIPLVTGTTALSENQQEQVMKLSEKVAVVQASNFSVGINLLTNLIERAAMALK